MRDLVTPLGPLRRWALAAADEAALLAEERAFAAGLPERRRREWVAGRLALRSLVRDHHGVELPPVLVDGRGGPALPSAILASISHKGEVAAALLGDAALGPRAGVGVDLEDDAPTRGDLAARLLTAAELTQVATLDDAARRHEVRRRFAVKEAIYKAVAPQVRRYVGFAEVELAPAPAAGGITRYEVRTRAGDLDGAAIEAAFTVVDGLIVAWASARWR